MPTDQQFQDTLEKLKRLRADHLKVQHDLVFYPYQDEVSDRILGALLQNLRITKNATEEEIKSLKQVEIAIEQSRQSGKTYGIAHTCEFILTFLPTLFRRPIHIGIFAAQLDQAKISYKLLRNGMRQAKSMMLVTKEQEKDIAQEENARTLVLPDGSSVIIAPINKTSLIEGSTLDIAIIDEAQLADDEVVMHSIWPMLASTNGPRIYIGKAGTRICHFYRLGQQNNSMKVYFDDVVKQRREQYERAGDARHLIYEQTVRQDIERDGIDADHIQREYFGKWQIGSGQFVTQEELDALISIPPRKLTYNYKKTNCFVGIDTGKAVDSTVVTVIRDSGEMVGRLLPDGKTKEYARQKDVLNWIELRGDNYQDQFDVIKDFMKMYNVVAVAIDATAQGDFMPDLFERNTQWQDENTGLYRVKFSAISKDMMFMNLKASIKQRLTTLPDLHTKIGERFRAQMLDLQQEKKGQLLSVKHPDNHDAHDDFCFSADTKILTDKGQVSISDIKVGDLVMTRSGYKRVINAGMTGYEKVITRFGITATPNHPFITTTGVKRFDNLSNNDKIYIWQVKSPNITVKSIIDIQKQNNTATSIISSPEVTIKKGSPLRGHFSTVISGLIILGQYLEDILSTTKTTTRLITIPQILYSLQGQNIASTMLMTQRMSQRRKNLLRLPELQHQNGMVALKAKNGIRSTWRTAYKHNDGLLSVLFAVLRKLLTLPIQMLNIVVKNVGVNSLTINIKRLGRYIENKSIHRYSQQKSSVSTVEIPNLHTNQREPSFVVASAKIDSKSLKIRVPVYNLQVEDSHEYFANNVLVHNCDSWALAEWAFAQYYAKGEPQLVVIGGSKKEYIQEDNVERDSKGNVVNYWPGEEPW